MPQHFLPGDPPSPPPPRRDPPEPRISPERIALKVFLYLAMVGFLFDARYRETGGPVAATICLATLAILAHFPSRDSRDR